MPFEFDKAPHTTFINRWKWILSTFPCIETALGVPKLIEILISLIPYFKFNLLVSDSNYTSLDDFV